MALPPTNAPHKVLLVWDFGTTGIKVLSLNPAGDIIARETVPVVSRHPQPGWVEQDPQQWFTDALACSERVLQQLEQTWQQVAGLAITNQRETIVAWDADTHSPIAPALVWQCRRTETHCNTLLKGSEAAGITAKTGLHINPYFSATKLAWLAQHHPQVSAQNPAFRWGTLDTWIIWQLTQGQAYVTEATNASRTLLFNTATGNWDDSLFETFGLKDFPRPTLSHTTTALAHTDPSITGGSSIPILAVLGDQQAALLAQLAATPTLGAKVTLGTGTFAMAPLESSVIERSKTADELPPALLATAQAHGLLVTAAHLPSDVPTLALEASVFSAGAAVEWAVSTLGLAPSPEALHALACSVPVAGGVMFLPALTGLGTPDWRADVNATWAGITPETTPAHQARALYEAIAFQAADVLMRLMVTRETLNPKAFQSSPPIIVLDGGLSKASLIQEGLTALLSWPVLPATASDMTALGVGWLAGQRLGWWDMAQLQQNTPPQTPNTLAPSQKAHWYKAYQDWGAWCHDTLGLLKPINQPAIAV